jgi:uncharacterized protein YjbI with pentapeptide repeats
MTEINQLEMLKNSVTRWNQWRKDNPDIVPFLSKAKLGGANLQNANLQNASLHKAELGQANLKNCNLCNAFLYQANLMQADLEGADLRKANLEETNFFIADLKNTNLEEADLQKAYLVSANLENANLKKADLNQTRLSNANLIKANLSQAHLMYSSLIKTDLSFANLNECYIYGTSVWDVKTVGTIQTNLVISPPNESIITIDNIKIAQFIYLLLNNSEIRDVIDTLTSKAVLILGRFSEERKVIIDSIAQWLRENNYVPIIMDFSKPKDRSFTETIRILAGLCKYIIADLTDPKSVPHESASIIPFIKTPFIPLIQKGSKVYSMFPDLKDYPWVMNTVEYSDKEDLFKIMRKNVIEPAERINNKIKSENSVHDG